jgi:hypothetical protein
MGGLVEVEGESDVVEAREDMDEVEGERDGHG